MNGKGRRLQYFDRQSPLFAIDSDREEFWQLFSSCSGIKDRNVTLVAFYAPPYALDALFGCQRRQVFGAHKLCQRLFPEMINKPIAKRIAFKSTTPIIVVTEIPEPDVITIDHRPRDS